jgi:hypothetical protein
MKRFVRRQAADDRQLKIIARADERKAELQSASTITASETLTMDASVGASDVTGDVTSEEVPVAPPRPSLDQMWGLT